MQCVCSLSEPLGSGDPVSQECSKFYWVGRPLDVDQHSLNSIEVIWILKTLVSATNGSVDFFRYLERRKIQWSRRYASSSWYSINLAWSQAWSSASSCDGLGNGSARELIEAILRAGLQFEVANHDLGIRLRSDMLEHMTIRQPQDPEVIRRIEVSLPSPFAERARRRD